MGSPVPLQLVEMGPGRGSLAVDILRVILTFLILITKYSYNILSKTGVEEMTAAGIGMCRRVRKIKCFVHAVNDCTWRYC